VVRVASADAVGQAAADVLPGWEEPLARVLSGSGPQTFPVTIAGDERWISISGVQFPAGTVYAFRDVTDAQRIEQLKTEFVSTVSHELRTPLAAVYGAAQTLQRPDVRMKKAQRERLLDMITNEGARLSRIVDDILLASRLDANTAQLRIESHSPADLADAVVEAARSYAPASIDLMLNVDPRLPPVAVDPDKIRQVLANLLDNAVKYSPDGGRVELAATREGDRLQFRVSDEGLGIPPAEHARIWQKFYRLDPNLTRGVGGTGLGLYISSELVRRMGGRIWVESDGSAGSRFFVELPLASLSPA
jgi:signal transduction histidine kinase